MERNDEPTAMRAVGEGGKNKSLKMSIGKKMLHADQGMARVFYQSFLLNGVQYCRRHLMISCHLCEVDNSNLRQEVDEERENLGLRPGGDPCLNKKAEKWHNFIAAKQIEAKHEVKLLREKYGENVTQTNPKAWMEFQQSANADERKINDRFLKEVQETMDAGASQCCYWACKTPNGSSDAKEGNATSTATTRNTKLLRCAGCGIAKYCCKEHQKLDWGWEHRGECSCQLPKFLVDEMEQDRQRNLQGDYSEYAVM